MTRRTTAEIELLPHDVYWLYDNEGRVLYVGCTVNLDARLIHHRATKAWFVRIARIETETFPTRPLGRAREAEAIQAERPLFNYIPPIHPPMPAVIKRSEGLRAVEEAS